MRKTDALRKSLLKRRLTLAVISVVLVLVSVSAFLITPALAESSKLEEWNNNNKQQFLTITSDSNANRPEGVSIKHDNRTGEQFISISLSLWREFSSAGRNDWKESDWDQYYSDIEMKVSAMSEDDKKNLDNLVQAYYAGGGLLYDDSCGLDLFIYEYMDYLNKNPNDPRWNANDDLRTMHDDSMKNLINENGAIKNLSDTEEGKIIQKLNLENTDILNCIYYWCPADMVMKSIDNAYGIAGFGSKILGESASNLQVRLAENGSIADVLVYGDSRVTTKAKNIIEKDENGKIKIVGKEYIYSDTEKSSLSPLVRVGKMVIHILAGVFIIFYAAVHLFHLMAKDNGSVESWMRLFIFTAFGFIMVENIEVFATLIERLGLSVILNVKDAITRGWADVYNQMTNLTLSGYIGTSGQFWQLITNFMLAITYIAIIAGALGYLFELTLRRMFLPVAAASIAIDGIEGARSGGVKYLFNYLGIYVRMAAFITVIMLYTIAVQHVQLGQGGIEGMAGWAIILIIAIRTAATIAMGSIGHILKEVFA